MFKEITLQHSQMNILRDDRVTGEYDIEFYHEDDPWITVIVSKGPAQSTGRTDGRRPSIRWQTNYGGSAASAKMFAEVLADAIAFAEAQS